MLNLNKKMKEQEEEEKRYGNFRRPRPSTSEMIASILNQIDHQSYAFEGCDLWITFKENLVKYLPKDMPKPNMVLVQTGMEIDLRSLVPLNIGFKQLKYGNSTDLSKQAIKKGTFWILNEEKGNRTLFEFPVDDYIQTKTDLIFLIDPWTIPDDDGLTEVFYKENGVTIMKKFDIKDARKLLANRKKLFDSAPTATNVILLFQLMDAIVLNDYKTGALSVDKTGEKNLVRLEKLKNLALNTTYNEERKNAVEKCFIQYNILFSQVEEVR